MSSVTKSYYSPTATQKATVGDTKLSMVTVDHIGWLLCDGRSLNIKKFNFLYNVIGNKYGGDGITTFKLPNPAGRVLGVIGTGVSPALTTRAVGDIVGAETHVLTTSEMPTHNHPGSSNSTNSTGITLNNAASVSNTNTRSVVTSTVSINSTDPAGAANNANLSLTDPQHTHTLTIANDGLSYAHNNMQPTLFVGNMFVYSGIVASGIYPFMTKSMVY